MTAPSYVNNGPVDCPEHIDTSNLKGKCAIVTGGSSGLGAAYVKGFADAGAFVVNADISPPTDEVVASKSLFIKCDVTSFAEQKAVFLAAIEKSPKRGVDIVVANAGIYGQDLLEGLDDDEPKETDLKMLNINLIGVIHTTRLAAYYFNRQPKDKFDRCLILKSSIMGYIDTKGATLYGAAKHGIRGMMCVLRRKGIMRVNAVAPWFIATPILPDIFIDSLTRQFQAQGTDFATVDDAVRCILRVSTDESLNGRSFAIVSRRDAPSGYVDLDMDDFKEGQMCDKLQKIASSIVYPHLDQNS